MNAMKSFNAKPNLVHLNKAKKEDYKDNWNKMVIFTGKK